MVAKRQATGQEGRAGKKVKLDPVSAKLKVVIDALSREDCDLHGPASHRECILAGFPLAVGLGAAKDERHAYQEEVANIVFEVLKSTEEKFQQTLAAAKEELSAAQSVQATKEGGMSKAETTLEEQRKMEQEARDALLGSQEGLKQATTKLKEASKEVENFDVVQIAKAQERAEFGSAFETEFEKLKTGACEDGKEMKSSLSTLSLILKKLEADQGLCNAAAPALSKAPAQRGDFDNMVVEQIETSLKSRVNSLEADLSDGEMLKATKVTEQTSAQEARNAAQATVEANQATVVAAEAKTKELEAALTQAKASLKEQDKVVGDIDVKVFYEQCHLENFQEATQALEFLRDRPSTTSENDAEVEKVSAIEIPVGVDEANLVA